MDIIENIIQDTCDHHALKIENAIKDVLPIDMSLEEIAQRCKFISHVDTPDEKVLYLDDKPLLKIYPMEFKQEGTKITISQNVQRL